MIRTQRHIRWMIRRDMDAVLDIDRQCFGESAWTEERFVEHLRRQNMIGVVSESEKQIEGWMLYEIHADSLEVIRAAVEPVDQRSGAGADMIQRLKDKLQHGRRTHLRATVSEDETEAQLWLSACGFRAVEVARNGGRDNYGFRFQIGGAV